MSDYRAPLDGQPPGGPDEPPTERTATAPAPPPQVAPATRPPAAPKSGWRAAIGWLRRVLRFVAGLAVIYAVAVLALVVAYRWVDPPFTTLTLVQRAGGAPVLQRWVPLDRISPNLVRAVVMSEDARFCSHSGVDWREIEEAFERSIDGDVRGGSTISMQVAKNLFLWPSRSYLRKAIEIPLTLVMEQVWSKPRMLEIYLNIAEWGPGVFGAEAAALHTFRKSALRLTEQEAALLAVALPNPIQRNAGDPGPGMQRLADTIRARMRASGPYARCIFG
jgi:monofunctional biosynthetic peptidoglycan transglycosylase